MFISNASHVPPPANATRSIAFRLDRNSKVNVCFPVLLLVAFFLARSKAVCELCRNLSAGADSYWGLVLRGYYAAELEWGAGEGAGWGGGVDVVLDV
jgi:hypothetical protein